MSRNSNPNPNCLDSTLLQAVILYKENTVISVGGDTSCEDFNWHGLATRDKSPIIIGIIISLCQFAHLFGSLFTHIHTYL